MNTILETYFRSHIHLSDQSIQQVSSLAKEVSLRRNELLLQQGQVCRHKIFVVKGLLRTFGTAPDGSEHVLQFAPENSWTLDVESYDKQSPAQSSIGAIEPSEVVLWTKRDFEQLLADIPALKAFSQQLVSRNIYNSRQRLLTMLSATPEEKYEDFVSSNPDLLARLPLHMIAAYLGISLKTLTRIRRSQLHH